MSANHPLLSRSFCILCVRAHELPAASDPSTHDDLVVTRSARHGGLYVLLLFLFIDDSSQTNNLKIFAKFLGLVELWGCR